MRQSPHGHVHGHQDRTAVDKETSVTIDAVDITGTEVADPVEAETDSELAGEELFEDYDPETGTRAPERTRRRNTRRPGGGARGPRRGSKLRRTVERTLGIAGLDPATCALLAIALDVNGDPGDAAFLVDLVLAILEDPRPARETLSALIELNSVSDLEAGVLATGMAAERTTFRRLWSVLRAVEPSLPATIPHKPTQAGMTVARCARGLTKAQRATVERTVEVLA